MQEDESQRIPSSYLNTASKSNLSITARLLSNVALDILSRTYAAIALISFRKSSVNSTWANSVSMLVNLPLANHHVLRSHQPQSLGVSDHLSL